MKTHSAIFGGYEKRRAEKRSAFRQNTADHEEWRKTLRSSALRQMIESRKIDGGRRFVVAGYIVSEQANGEVHRIRPAPVLARCGD